MLINSSQRHWLFDSVCRVAFLISPRDACAPWVSTTCVHTGRRVAWPQAGLGTRAVAVIHNAMQAAGKTGGLRHRVAARFEFVADGGGVNHRPIFNRCGGVGFGTKVGQVDGLLDVKFPVDQANQRLGGVLDDGTAAGRAGSKIHLPNCFAPLAMTKPKPCTAQ